ncbi:MAG: hypothetical protein V2B19_19315 [Pseudomonadota bacterium]
MNKKGRGKAMADWKTLLKGHPAFARVFLAQQAMLIEASQLGFGFVDVRMSQILRTGLPVLFEDYWISRCKQTDEENLPPMVECITELNRDPARCFNLDPGGWFDDPLAGGQAFPPKPPNPHI